MRSSLIHCIKRYCFTANSQTMHFVVVRVSLQKLFHVLSIGQHGVSFMLTCNQMVTALIYAADSPPGGPE